MPDPALARAIADLAGAVRALTAHMASRAPPTSRAAPSRDERPADVETILAADFPTADEGNWARGIYPRINVTREAQLFRDYYTRKALLRRDWHQAWASWMGRAKEVGAPSVPAVSPAAHIPREPKWYDGLSTEQYTAERQRRSEATRAGRRTSQQQPSIAVPAD